MRGEETLKGSEKVRLGESAVLSIDLERETESGDTEQSRYISVGAIWLIIG